MQNTSDLLKRSWILLGAFGLVSGTLAQNGDRAGEEQKPLPPDLDVPAAPVLSPEEALESFQLAPGFKIQLVASEPLIHDPVEIEFDPDGRIWVCEMRGYMPNINGTGEDVRNGRIVVLTDVDGDGVMDESEVFADGLQMPRAIALVHDGLLVAEPPHLWFMKDTNGDGKADFKTEITDDYANQINPEHNANGLLWSLDNWVYSANYTFRFRSVNQVWEKEPTIFRGQWGLSQDNYGRHFYDTNSDQLRGDIIPSHYLDRNPNFSSRNGLNIRVAQNQFVWPIRITPGVNRGYRNNTLRDNWKLRTFTAACGPVVYRGHLFPEEFSGNAFVCEPSGNLIKRNIVWEENGMLTSKHAYEESEFLASTDERFRPVNLNNGPDGSLYVVDFYRGIIQHRIYMTSFLRKQVEDRQLDQPIGMGRIYRVYPENNPPSAPVKLGSASSQELVQYLKHDNGWVRQTAQRLLVERTDTSVAPSLRKLAATGSETARIHALWTLHGMQRVDIDTVVAALNSDQRQVRIHGMRVGEALIGTPDESTYQAHLMKSADSDDAMIRVQLAFSLGEINSVETDLALKNLLMASGDSGAENSMIRDAVLSGLGGRELKFLGALIADKEWNSGSKSRTGMIRELAQAVLKSASEEQIQGLFGLVASFVEMGNADQMAILDGILNLVAPSKGKPLAVELVNDPAGLTALQFVENDAVLEKVSRILDSIEWGESVVAKLNARADASAPASEVSGPIAMGRTLYAATCGACHQANGQGLDGLAPPLAGSDWVTGPEERLARIILHGLTGPITVNDVTYQMEMPALSVFDDEQIAGVMSYIRQEWGNQAKEVSAETVKKIRETTAQRTAPWTQEELLQIP